MDGLDYSTSGGTGLDGIDSNHGGAESVIRGSGSANQSRATRAVGARSQLAATLGAVGQSGWFRNLLWKCLERKDLAAVPVNQRIVVVEPIVSKNKHNGRVQLSNIKCYPNDVTSRMTDG